MTPNTPALDGSAPRSPSTAPLPRTTKMVESLRLLRSHRSETRAGSDFAWIFDDLAEYDRLLRRHTGRDLSRARVLEIGYGARPFRLITLLGRGVDAEGVDAEAPVLDGRISEYLRALRCNGIERTLKSAARHVLFDGAERRRFTAALAARGLTPTVDPARFHVGDAAAFAPRHDYDLIFSEDVFEHIAPGSLTVLVPKLAAWLAPGGIAVIRPNIFTGITGGHALDWSRHSFTQARPRRRTEPWDHLRARRHRPNTYLNELSRQDYRELLAPHFSILEEHVALPGLGREFLTGAVARDLAGFAEEELFSNQVRMVLRRR